jgi:hypothetical protein
VVAAPGLDDRRTGAVLESSRAAVLVSRAGRVRRPELEDAVAVLARLVVPCLGVVLRDRDGAEVALAGAPVTPPGRNGTRPAPVAALAGGDASSGPGAA